MLCTTALPCIMLCDLHMWSSFSNVLCIMFCYVRLHVVVDIYICAGFVLYLVGVNYQTLAAVSPPSCKRYRDYIGVETGATRGGVAGARLAAGYGSGGAGLPTGGTSHAAGARPLVLPETFDGTGSWSDWCFHFEDVAAVNWWDGTQKLQWLRVHVTGRGQKALHRPAPRTRLHRMPYACVSTPCHAKRNIKPNSS